MVSICSGQTPRLFPSSPWFGTNVQGQTSADGVRNVLGLTSSYDGIFTQITISNDVSPNLFFIQGGNGSSIFYSNNLFTIPAPLKATAFVGDGSGLTDLNITNIPGLTDYVTNAILGNVNPNSLTNLDTRYWTNDTGIYGNGLGLTNLSLNGIVGISNYITNAILSTVNPNSLTNLDTRSWTNNTGIYGNGIGLTNLNPASLSGSIQASNISGAVSEASHATWSDYAEYVTYITNRIEYATNAENAQMANNISGVISSTNMPGNVLTNLDTRNWTNNTGIYGNGSGLTNIPASSLTGTGAYVGTFTGNAAGLTNLPAASVSGVISLTNLPNTVVTNGAEPSFGTTYVGQLGVAGGKYADAYVIIDENGDASGNSSAGVVWSLGITGMSQFMRGIVVGADPGPPTTNVFIIDNDGIAYGNGSGLTNLQSTSIVGTITNPIVTSGLDVLGSIRVASVTADSIVGNALGMYNLSATNVVGLLTNNTTGTATGAQYATNTPYGGTLAGLSGTNVWTGTNTFAGPIVLSNTLSFLPGIGTNTIIGSSDQSLVIIGTAPSQQTTSVAGNAISIVGGPATGGSSVNGGAAGGAINLTGGTGAVRVNGAGAGGAVNITGGQNAITGYGLAGNVTIRGGPQVSASNSGTGGGNVYIIGGYTTQPNGIDYGNVYISTPDGVVSSIPSSSSTPTPVISIVGGNGAANNSANSTSGRAGTPIIITSGAGGSVRNSGGTGAAIKGADIIITAGAGGTNSGSPSGLGANGGNIVLSPGAAGTGVAASGTNGIVYVNGSVYITNTLYLGVNSNNAIGNLGTVLNGIVLTNGTITATNGIEAGGHALESTNVFQVDTPGAAKALQVGTNGTVYLGNTANVSPSGSLTAYRIYTTAGGSLNLPLRHSLYWDSYQYIWASANNTLKCGWLAVTTQQPHTNVFIVPMPGMGVAPTDAHLSTPYWAGIKAESWSNSSPSLSIRLTDNSGYASLVASNITLSGAITATNGIINYGTGWAGTTNTAPTDTTTVKAWVNYTNTTGDTFKLPVYGPSVAGTVTSGRATLTSGTNLVSTSLVTTNSIIMLTYVSLDGSSSSIYYKPSEITNNASFTIRSTSSIDTNQVNWNILP